MATPELKSYEEARDWMYALKNRGSKYGIDRMQLLVEELGHPESAYPCIHVAGTNGKGSTCAMLEGVLRGHGLRVGLSTSPHIVRQGERVQVDRAILSEDMIFQYVKELQGVAERIAARDPELHPSFFEFMTAMAFLHFQRSEVDVAVVEVGLGGRLDASNVLHPEVSVITSIGLDHCDILGNSLAEIAREKAGIIKPGVPVVVGLLPEEALLEIRQICAERDCSLYELRERFGDKLSAYPETNLRGGYQRINAAIAFLASEVLSQRFALDMEVVSKALMHIDWRGRWEERMLNRRKIVFDVTHNSEGALWLERNLECLVEESGGARPDCVMGVMGADRAASLVPVVARWARSLTFVQPEQSRALSGAALEAFVPAGFQGTVRQSSIEALFPAKGVCSMDEATEHPLVVTGSLYLIGEVWDRLYEETPSGQGALQDF